MLEYSLHENLLTERTDDYSAQTHSKASYNREQFIDLMLQRGTLMTKTDALAVLNNIEETVAYIVKNGGMINMPLFNTGFSISGVFEGAADVFDPNRHHLHVNISKGTLLRDAEKDVKLTKVNVALPQPQILEVKDSVTGSIDSLLTAGGVIEIVGVNIKIAGENSACGLYFVDAGGTETKAVTLVNNKPATVIAIIPALAAGEYHVKIVTQYAAGKDLKEPKTTVYSKLLRLQ
ncbi:MAG: DUF4469 domain-containing protein [Prevotellaceae bacterium]|jgi:hypothetical protein|nr:DUF4469 domain-containing protein [Prevotellaceae bacterium]